MFEDLNSIDVSKSTDNKDLIWDIDTFKQRKRAHEFVLNFENKLCVYSGSVEQLYTNYNIFMPAEENSRLVILPNPYAHHDIFHGIPDEAVKPTGLYIVPGEKGELLLRIPLRTGGKPFHLVPLQVGFKLINQRRPAHLPLLPVLVKGDLRELDARTPCLHLHAISLSNMDNLSPLEINEIRRTILDRMLVLA
jgi:hypothetical protein